MLALAVVLGYAAGCAAVFALVVLAALPFRFVRATQNPAIAAALACGTLFALGLWIDGAPDHLERPIGFYAVAFLISVRFYGWRDARRARSAQDVRAGIGLASALPAGAPNASGELDDLSGGP